jgi:hypothetical protein
MPRRYAARSRLSAKQVTEEVSNRYDHTTCRDPPVEGADSELVSDTNSCQGATCANSVSVGSIRRRCRLCRHRPLRVSDNGGFPRSRHGAAQPKPDFASGVEAAESNPRLIPPASQRGRGRQRAGAGDEPAPGALEPEVAGPHERNARLARSLAADMDRVLAAG